MGVWCAVAANSSLPGSVCSLLLVWVSLRDLGDSPFQWTFHVGCYPQPRLQTSTRGAFGKPQGTVARVHVGQVIMSIRTKLQNKEHVIEALCRAKFKFPGHHKIHILKKWAFTKFNADEFEDRVAEKRLIPDGCGVKYIPNHGPLDKWRALHS
nr:PREDICTED: 60S ribosomal protein L10-like [Equus przewalskii]